MEEQLDALIVQNEKNNKEVNDNLEALIVQTQKNDNKDELEAIAKVNLDTKNVIKKGNKEIVGALKELTPKAINGIKANDLVLTLLSLLKGENGKTPIKGEDYFTEEEIESFKKEITPKKGEDYIDGKDGLDGYTPKKGKDYFTDKEIKQIIDDILKQIPKPKDGLDGDDGKDAEVDYDKILKLVIKKLPKIEKPKEKTIEEFIKDLKGKLSFNDLKDLPLTLKQAARDYDFLELKDTPNSYKDKAGNILIVSADEKSLEFTTPQAIEDVNWGEINGTLSDQTDLQDALNLKANKTEIPTKNSQLENDSEFITLGDVPASDMLKATYDPAGGERQVAFSDEVWKLGGNTLGSKKTIGSIDNQDFGIITNNSERLTVLKDGNVGIGTTTPTAKLSIIGAGIGTGVVFRTAGSTDSPGITVLDSGKIGNRFSLPVALFQTDTKADAQYADDGSKPTWRLSYSGTPVIDLSMGNSYQAIISNPYSGGSIGGLQFRTGGLGTTFTRMTISQTGNVGIGTTAPNQQLEITKNFRLPATSGTTPYGIIYKDGNSFIHDFNYGNNGTVSTDGGNTFVGINAGNFMMGSTATSASQASYNTGIGYQSLYSNTTGQQNTANGYQSLFSNTTGYQNTALGYNSGRYIADGTTGRSTGNNGLYLGYNSMASANGTDNEIVIGYGAIGNGSNTVTIGNSSITDNYFKGKVHADQYKLSDLNTAPSSSTDTGVKGEIRVTADAIYICIDTDTWVKTNLITF